MKVSEVNWKANFPHNGVSAKVALNAVERLRQKHGGQVTPEHIVEAARPAKSELHALFEWDDAKAAAEHRRAQAGRMLRSIEVVYKEMPKTPMRHFEIIQKKHSSVPESRTYYSTAEEVMADPKARDRLVAEAVKSLIQFRRRYEGLSELEVVLRSIDAVLAELTKV